MSERMPHEVASVEDLRSVIGVNGTGRQSGPQVMTVGEVMAAKTHKPEMLVEKIVPLPGSTAIVASNKTGKTLIAAEIGLAVATGTPLFDYYSILKPGPVLFVEKDDPGGLGSMQEILRRTKLSIAAAPFYTVTDIDMTLGPDFILWLDREIQSRQLRLVILDSYTALREAHASGGDLVKREQSDMTILDELAKKHGISILLIHHYSKGSINHDWSEKAAGTFAITAATEAQIALSRFPDLAGNATERLMRVRGRHFEGVDMVLRLNTETLAFDHVLEGGAAAYYSDLLALRTTFGAGVFSPKALAHDLGFARSTAHKLINRLAGAGAIRKTGYGEYRLDVTL